MKKLLLIVLMALSISGIAQILDNTEGQTFGEKPFFNTDFVKRNHLKSIKGYYATKATLDYIRKSDDIYQYNFDEDGNLIRSFKTQFKDTLISMFEYDSLGQLILMRRSDNAGFHSYHYTYDEKGRIASQEYRRDISSSGNKLNFELDRTFIVSTERFEYLELDSLNYRKDYFNNSDLIYKQEYFTFNADGYLVKTESRLKMGSGLKTTTFTYNELGLVMEKKMVNRMTTTTTSKWRYEYDEFGNIMAQHHTKNEVDLTEHQIVYKQDSFLLEAVITRDHATELLTILEFADYTFYD